MSIGAKQSGWLVDVFRGASQGLRHNPARIEKMLGLKIVARPLRALFKLDTYKITSVPVAAVPNNAPVFSAGTLQSDRSALRNRLFQLDTRALPGNVVQIGNSVSLHDSLIFPDHLDQFGTK